MTWNSLDTIRHMLMIETFTLRTIARSIRLLLKDCSLFYQAVSKSIHYEAHNVFGPGFFQQFLA